ncbi:MAG: hypothetical protein CVV16_07745 [Gammaproteobacteria bacterium HGW-Gammaproteobacteria-6]|nr:MAG: hypothetical protein CVV16_07745 [Gammaproteobacteria bacterium HGW-Gammaproteobacteria-6]
MSLPKLQALFVDLSTRMQSAEFLVSARHPEHPTAFTRCRKLPAASLVAPMLSGMRRESPKKARDEESPGHPRFRNLRKPGESPKPGTPKIPKAEKARDEKARDEKARDTQDSEVSYTPVRGLLTDA